MQQQSIHNKMLVLDHESKVKFNVTMHGVSKGVIVDYGRSSNVMKLNIRRRLADLDGSVEIVEPELANSKNKNEKPLDGMAASTKIKGVK